MRDPNKEEKEPAQTSHSETNGTGEHTRRKPKIPKKTPSEESSRKKAAGAQGAQQQQNTTNGSRKVPNSTEAIIVEDLIAALPPLRCKEKQCYMYEPKTGIWNKTSDNTIRKMMYALLPPDWATQSKVKNLLVHLKSEVDYTGEFCTAFKSDENGHDYLWCLENKTMRINTMLKEVTLEEHNSKHGFTAQLPVAYDETLNEPKILQSILD